MLSHLHYNDILENHVLIFCWSIHPLSSYWLVESSKHNSVKNLQRWRRGREDGQVTFNPSFLTIRNKSQTLE